MCTRFSTSDLLTNPDSASCFSVSVVTPVGVGQVRLRGNKSMDNSSHSKQGISNGCNSPLETLVFNLPADRFYKPLCTNVATSRFIPLHQKVVDLRIRRILISQRHPYAAVS
ncbi:hypothetical protein Tco_0822003 [Tanacetum coccineum]|uniref:Uncharacterized protein n=1 Tax=Tanacetum coccineum TaxID=301880 RepID=A0ABQ5AIP9_9ASTR